MADRPGPEEMEALFVCRGKSCGGKIQPQRYIPSKDAYRCKVCKRKNNIPIAFYAKDRRLMQMKAKEGTNAVQKVV